MLQESAHKAMMNRLGSRMCFKGRDEFFVFREEGIQQQTEERRLHRIHELHQIAVHIIRIIFGDGKIILRVVTAFVCLERPVNRHLQSTVEDRDFAVYFHIIVHGEIADPHGVRLPDLAADGAGLIGQRHIFIFLAVFRRGRILLLAKINADDIVAFAKLVDIFHTNLFLLIREFVNHFVKFFRVGEAKM